MSQGFLSEILPWQRCTAKGRDGGKTLDSPLGQSPKPGDSTLGWLLVPRTSEGWELHAAMLRSEQIPKDRVKASSVSAWGGSRVDPQPFWGCSHHAKPCDPIRRCLHPLHPCSARPTPPSQS